MAEAAALVTNPPAAAKKKKRNLPGTPDPEAEVIALSPKTLLATNRFVCEICGKGFQREQNLQLHRRGHNLPWKLRPQRSEAAAGGGVRRKRVYVCPERSCVHHHPSRALGDLTGIKKHFYRKHGEKRWKCDRCAKRYAVQSDWKAHAKTCGTREYRCDCGTIFSRRDSFVTHRAFCDALAMETARVAAAASNMSGLTSISANSSFDFILKPTALQTEATSELVDGPPAMPGLSLWIADSRGLPPPFPPQTLEVSTENNLIGNYPFFSRGNLLQADQDQLVQMYQYSSCVSSSPLTGSLPSLYSTQHQEMVIPQHMSATGLLQKAAQIGVVAAASCSAPALLGGIEMVKTCSNNNGIIDVGSGLFQMRHSSLATEKNSADGIRGGGETRDFLGVDAPPVCATQFNGWI